MRMPVSIGGRDHQVRASIGIALFPDDGAQLDELLHNADLAMYRAKDLGRGAAVFYNPRMSRRGMRVADSGLYRAFKRREFSLYFQPQYSVADGRMLGVEALLRWQSPREGVICVRGVHSRGRRIRPHHRPGWLGARSGLRADRAVAGAGRRSAAHGGEPLRAAAARPGAGPEPAPRAGASQHAAVADWTGAERSRAHRSGQPGPASRNWRELGVGLMLDDFGTGHTALNNLRRYPVQCREDRPQLHRGSGGESCGRRAGQLHHRDGACASGKQVIAEGVETIEQLEFLRERGCDVAQGYFLARPLPVGRR